MLKVIKHEVAHIVFDSLGNPDGVPIGISEGIAVSIAGQVEPDFLIDNEPSSIIEHLYSGFEEEAIKSWQQAS